MFCLCNKKNETWIIVITFKPTGTTIYYISTLSEFKKQHSLNMAYLCETKKCFIEDNMWPENSVSSAVCQNNPSTHRRYVDLLSDQQFVWRKGTFSTARVIWHPVTLLHWSHWVDALTVWGEVGVFPSIVVTNTHTDMNTHYQHQPA